MKISIITAAYNCAATIRDTIESVLKQTYSDIEYIVIDGNSQDETVAILREYEPRFNGRMRWISEPDKGIYDAMNKGIRMASGDIVGLLNSDDFYTDSHVLDRVVAGIGQVDAVYGDVHYVHPDRLDRCVRYYSSRLFRRWMMRLGFMPAHPSFYCRRDVYERFGVFDTSFEVAADFESLLRFIFLHRIQAKYIPADFVTMRTGGASSSGWTSHKKILRDHMAAYRKNGMYSDYFLEGLRYLYKLGEMALHTLKSAVGSHA